MAGPPFITMSASDTSGRRVLLIDDDESIAGSLRSYLLMSGFDVDVALEPSAAESLMAANEYRTVVVDPYLTGVHDRHSALLGRVCALQKTAAIIVLTAYSSPALARVASECKVDALLTKPQSVVFLKSLIRSASSYSTPEHTRNHP